MEDFPYKGFHSNYALHLGHRLMFFKQKQQLSWGGCSLYELFSADNNECNKLPENGIINTILYFDSSVILKLTLQRRIHQIITVAIAREDKCKLEAKSFLNEKKMNIS